MAIIVIGKAIIGFISNLCIVIANFFSWLMVILPWVLLGVFVIAVIWIILYCCYPDLLSSSESPASRRNRASHPDAGKFTLSAPDSGAIRSLMLGGYQGKADTESRHKTTDWRDDPVSDRQRSLLEKRGYAVPTTKGAASDVISNMGYTLTPKQVAKLKFLNIKWRTAESGWKKLDKIKTSKRYEKQLAEWEIQKFTLHPDLCPVNKEAIVIAAPVPMPPLEYKLSDRQRAKLSFLAIPWDTEEAGIKALNRAIINPAYKERLAIWDHQKFGLYPHFYPSVKEPRYNRSITRKNFENPGYCPQATKLVEKRDPLEKKVSGLKQQPKLIFDPQRIRVLKEESVEIATRVSEFLEDKALPPIESTTTEELWLEELATAAAAVPPAVPQCSSPKPPQLELISGTANGGKSMNLVFDQQRTKILKEESSEIATIVTDFLGEESVPASYAIKEEAPLPELWLKELAERCQMPLKEIISKRELTEDEFNVIAKKHNVFPDDLFESINEWSDVCLGDFLLERDNGVKVILTLLPLQ